MAGHIIMTVWAQFKGMGSW